MALLELKNVSKSYGTTQALKDISLSVEEGQFVSVIGPSGAGKSTLLRCVNRLVDATRGTILLDGQDITKVRGRELRRVRTQDGHDLSKLQSGEPLKRDRKCAAWAAGAQADHKPARSGYYTEAEKQQAFQILERAGADRPRRTSGVTSFREGRSSAWASPGR